MKKRVFTVLILLICFCLCGCGAPDTADSDTALAEITFVLDWTPNTNHTGIYVAQNKGWFEAEGLKVNIMQPPENGAALMVASGEADFGIDFQDYLADAFAIPEPLPVTAVAAVVQHNTSGIISLKEKGITSPQGMAGHTYATWELPIEQAILKTVLQEDGSDLKAVKQIPATVTDVPAALNSDIDCVWVYYGVEGIACERAGLDTAFFSFADIDAVFDFYSPVIIANNAYLEAHPETAKAFLRAVKRGYEYAAAHPGEAAKLLCAEVPELETEYIAASQQYLSAQYIADAESWGVIDAERWNRFYRWLNENKLMECPIPEDYGFSMAYLE